MALCLMRIEAIKLKVSSLPIPKTNLEKLTKKTKRDLSYYFRHLEALPPEIHRKELKSYLEALDTVTYWSRHNIMASETRIKKLHGLLFNMQGPDVYRDGQNAVFNASMKKVLYLPPKAKEVPMLMQSLVSWLSRKRKLPCPLIAGIAHFGINAIHPYYDGNGRSARLITRWILGLGGYDIHGLYCLERTYANDLLKYYDALSLHGIKEYSEGRKHGDITPWLEYFLESMADSYEFSLRRIQRALLHHS